MFAIGQPALDLFEPKPEAVLPCCHVCGKHGELITVDGVGVLDLRAAAMWALLAISEHVRQEHPEVAR
jgi:transposase